MTASVMKVASIRMAVLYLLLGGHTQADAEVTV